MLLTLLVNSSQSGASAGARFRGLGLACAALVANPNTVVYDYFLRDAIVSRLRTPGGTVMSIIGTGEQFGFQLR